MPIDEVWLIGCVAVASSLLVVTSVGWWRASRRIRRLEAQLLTPPSQEEGAARLERLVENLALQVDELASGQEFLQRVVANRQVPKAPPEAPRVVTPV
jgi:hypothetical protein